MIAAETILGSSKHEELYYKQMIHSKNKGFITVAEKELEEFKQWHYKYSSLPSLVGKTDRYMSMNTFWKTYRRIEYLKELNTIYVDIDYYIRTLARKQCFVILQNSLKKRNYRNRPPRLTRAEGSMLSGKLNRCRIRHYHCGKPSKIILLIFYSSTEPILWPRMHVASYVCQARLTRKTIQALTCWNLSPSWYTRYERCKKSTCQH